MPTADPNKKQKRKPGPRERMISALILGLVAIVALAFVISGGLFAGVVDRTWGLRSLKSMIGLNEDPLFTLAPGSLTPAAPPVEIRIARRLLPDEMPGSYRSDVRTACTIRSAEKLEIVRETRDTSGRYKVEQAASKPEGLAAKAAELGSRCMYSASYLKDGTKAGGFTVDIVDAAEPANAMKLCAARMPEGARKLALGRGGWIAESPFACGFWTGRYYSELSNDAGGDLAELQSAAKALAGTQLAYGGPFDQQPAAQPAPEAQAQQPAPGASPAPAGVAQFAPIQNGEVLPPTKIERFTDNLYEKIDGKEGMFRAFHFVELRFGQYTDTRTQQSYDVYIYDMGEPVNAFGIHMGERSPKAEAWPLGRDGYVSGTSAYFCKDKYYVNVLGPPEGAADSLAVSQAIATAIAGTIPDNDKPFWVEQYLPAKGRVPHTLKYEATSGLGYEFLEQMFTADYKAGDKEYQLFLVRTDDASKATALFDRFVEATAKYDKVISKSSDADGQKMVGDSMGVFCAAFSKGRFFGGVTECEDQALAAREADVLKACLPGGGGASSSGTGSTKPAAGATSVKANGQG